MFNNLVFIPHVLFAAGAVHTLFVERVSAVVKIVVVAAVVVVVVYVAVVVDLR